MKTYHGTQLFYNPELGIVHAQQSETPEITAQIEDQKLLLYATVGNRKYYFYIDDQQKIKSSLKPVPLNFVYNDNGSISIFSYDSFWSARQVSGLLRLMPHNKDWERFTLEPTAAIELSKTKAITSTVPPVSKERCAGCTACAMVCPKGALTMAEDDEGFLSPTFNPDLCIDCGQCERVCPIKNPKKNPAPEISYAAWINDDARRMISSSGGLAYALSEAMLERGGAVCGAALEGFTVKHILVDNVDELRRLQGTKYVQSDLGNIFVEIKRLLKTGRQVLFIGTPCQVTGLKNFVSGLGENLLTVDLVCHGVPSPGVLRRYVDELRQRYPTAVTLSFRDKVYGWHRYHAFALYDEKSEIVFREGGPINAYIQGFLKNVFCRQSCAQCPFSTKERAGDITLSDYWGIEKFEPAFNDKKGISMAALHTDKGRAFFESMKEKLSEIRETPYSIAVQNQAQLRKPSAMSPLRAEFFRWLRAGRSVEYFLERKLFPVGILNFHFANSYGALLVSYSLQQAINSLGYSSENINFVVDTRNVQAFDEFRQAFIKTSKVPLGIRRLKSQNLNWKRVVVGSDQVWRMFNTNVYMCDWASDKKSLISYAASFGHTQYSGRIPVDRAKKLLGRFDFISVREDSGVDVCNETFDVEAVHVLDPTMLLTRERYEKLIDPRAVELPDKPYVVVAFINANTSDIISNEELLADFRKKYVLWNPLKDETGKARAMSMWLASIRNAQLIITDSFHVTAFSILFNKQFVSIVRANGLARIPSLLRKCGIPSTRIFKALKDVTLKSFDEKIDYEIVNRLVEKEREKGFMFLKMALAAPPNYKKPVE